MSLTVFTPKRGTSSNELEPVFMNLGVAYAATWLFKIVDLIEGGDPHEKA